MWTDVDMTNSELDGLNDGQRACLRLVLANLNSKEIARELGVSPHTVDQRLRTALRVLNVQSRFEAARKFALLDPEGTYQPLIYQSPAVEPEQKIGKLGRSTTRTDSESLGSKDNVLNADGGGPGIFLELTGTRRRLPIPRLRGEKNDLGAVERIGWTIAIAIGAALSFGWLIAGLEALSRLRG
ncbi:helix-turn-helix transcriptional regulator [Parasphingorhabdus sp.]|uniref:helix-turn-helix transcriptional regulator n=2 Tax=Parasphingorhabdus sp. TaxID=2709688 RepID=UPI003265E229